MSLSLSVHPLTQRKQSHFGSVLSHFKPQRSYTYGGMLNRKQNQNSATSSTVHLQGKKKTRCSCVHSVIIPKQLWYDGMNSRNIFPPPAFQRHCSAADPARPSLAGTGESAWPAVGSWRDRDNVTQHRHCCSRPAHCFWTGITLNCYFKCTKPLVSNENQNFC